VGSRIIQAIQDDHMALGSVLLPMPPHDVDRQMLDRRDGVHHNLRVS